MTLLPEDDDVALKLLHTADWHLGMRFPQFDDEDQPKLTRARLAVVESILTLGRSHRVDAILCAGDIFDDPKPEAPWYEGLSTRLRTLANGDFPIILLPGNHDPIRENSVYSPGHPFRESLPAWVHVVDCDDFELELSDEAVLYAAPCRSQAGESDLALSLPDRAAGDDRLRIGMVHGQTFDMDGHETNFPIAEDAAAQRGLDYLALGDTHAFRQYGTDEHPMVYPGAPEPTRFGEDDAGHVALVFFPHKKRRALIHKQEVGQWRWRDVVCRDPESLLRLFSDDLTKTVLRLRLDMSLPLARYDDAKRILRELKGTDVSHGRAGVLLADDDDLHVDATEDLDFVDDLPDVLRKVAHRLQHEADNPQAERALYHLYTLVKAGASP